MAGTIHTHYTAITWDLVRIRACMLVLVSARVCPCLYLSVYVRYTSVMYVMQVLCTLCKCYVRYASVMYGMQVVCTLRKCYVRYASVDRCLRNKHTDDTIIYKHGTP